MDIQGTYESAEPSNLWRQKNKSKKSLHVLEDGASGGEVGDIEQSICLKFVQNMIKLHWFDGFLQRFVMMTLYIQWIQGIW
jgi:hypothetical protein